MILKMKQNLFCLAGSLLICTVAYALEPMRFNTPQEAVKALVDCAKENNQNKFLEILGDDAKALINSGDSVEDAANREMFVKSFDEANTLEKMGDKEYMLTIGKDNWLFPIPIIKDHNQWLFDVQAGKDEILKRRIGRNEISAIKSVSAYVQAQSEYYLANPQHDKQKSYAQKIMSSQGKKDGLYYPVKDGEIQSPLGELYAKAQMEGYAAKTNAEKQQPYYGYYYRILTEQGANAPGGKKNYIKDGKMVDGFALVAWPATYGNSGVMTFIVNQDGIVYERDFGPDTLNTVEKISEYNPDQSWKVVHEMTQTN